MIGSVYVTDADDYDVADKDFDIDPSSPSPNDYFNVDPKLGNITMLQNTPQGTYTLKIRVSILSV